MRRTMLSNSSSLVTSVVEKSPWIACVMKWPMVPDIAAGLHKQCVAGMQHPPSTIPRPRQYMYTYGGESKKCFPKIASGMWCHTSNIIWNKIQSGFVVWYHFADYPSSTAVRKFGHLQFGFWTVLCVLASATIYTERHRWQRAEWKQSQFSFSKWDAGLRGYLYHDLKIIYDTQLASSKSGTKVKWSKASVSTMLQCDEKVSALSRNCCSARSLGP